MMDEYTGHWITTYTGKRLHYLTPTPDEIDVRDIAHALSMICRFGGQCRDFYSVAEHSLHVCNLVQPKYKLSALLHDAHEAYILDMPRPVKYDMPQYRVIANEIQRVIDEKFGTSTNEEIHNADEIMLATEARDLGLDMTDWVSLPPPLRGELRPLKHGLAEVTFLFKFKDLTEGLAVGVKQ